MQNILSKANRELLEQFAWSNVLLAFDFDGTLAPIVDDPERAYMRARTRKQLEQAAELYPTIVISGRTQQDALKRLSGVGVSVVIGNHGLEPWRGKDDIAQKVRAWHVTLQATIERFKGVRIEDKTFSLAIHYRQSREKKAARAAILRAAGQLSDVRIIGGKQVVNVLPNDAPHKGIALERERERLGCDTAIYVGDDETDEDVFMLDQPGRLLSIRVGAKRTSSAAHYIPRQGDVDGLLRSLIELRRRVMQLKQAAR